jgi:serine/threonine protein phosphatase PrpC
MVVDGVGIGHEIARVAREELVDSLAVVRLREPEEHVLVRGDE